MSPCVSFLPAGELHDPVTFKPLTDNAKIVAIATTGNVYLYDTIDRLNIKCVFLCVCVLVRACVVS